MTLGTTIILFVVPIFSLLVLPIFHSLAVPPRTKDLDVFDTETT